MWFDPPMTPPSGRTDTLSQSMTPPDALTIEKVLDRFLAEERQRLSPRTFRNYEHVVELLRHSLER